MNEWKVRRAFGSLWILLALLSVGRVVAQERASINVTVLRDAVETLWKEERSIAASPEKLRRFSGRARALLAQYYALPDDADRACLTGIAKAMRFVTADLDFTESEVQHVLDFLRRKLDADPTQLDGRSFDLVMRGLHMIRQGSAQTLAERWLDLAANFPRGPKGAWVRIEAGRQLVSVCGDAVGAEDVLTGALHELQLLAEWTSAERERLVDDADLWITMADRELAGSRADAIGQALLLRGFARVEQVKMVGALADLSAARAQLEATGNAHRMVNVEHNLASVWLQLGDIDRAIDTAQSAARAYQDPFWDATLGYVVVPDANGIGAMHRVEARARLARRGVGDVEKARALLGRVVSDEMLLALPETYCDAVLLLMEAWLVEPSDPAQRDACWARVEPAVDRLELRDQTMRTRCRLLRGRLALARGHLDDARSRLDEAAQLVNALGHRSLGLEVLVAQGSCELAAQDPEAALAHYEDAAREMVGLVLDQQLFVLPTALAAFQQRFDDLLAGAFRAWEQLRSSRSGSENLRRCYELAQRFHGFESWCWLLLTAPRNESAEVTRLRAERQRLYDAHALLLKEPKGSPSGQLRVRRQRRALEEELGKVASGLAAAKVASGGLSPMMSDADLGLAKVQACLEPGELLVECVDLPGCAVAFVLTRSWANVLPLPHGQEWRGALAQLAKWADERDGAMQVREVQPLVALSAQLLGDPAQAQGLTWLGERLARGDVKTLLWSPAGVFSRVPLAALPFRGRALGRDVAIVNVRSGSLLAQQRGAHASAAENTPRLLALGNPSYPAQQVAQLVQRDLVAGGELSPLPGTAREVLALGKLFAEPEELAGLEAIDNPGAFSGKLQGNRYQLLLGSAANKRALTPAALAEASVLHFACHGHVDPVAPALSALALTIDTADLAGEATGGLLHLDELVQLRGDYELVTLSACDSDRGAVRSHASETSLAWAAQMAGARRVLATRWKIADQHASVLVPDFYCRWLSGVPVAQALQQLIVEFDGKVPVREWAALTLWGEPR